MGVANNAAFAHHAIKAAGAEDERNPAPRHSLPTVDIARRHRRAGLASSLRADLLFTFQASSGHQGTWRARYLSFGDKSAFSVSSSVASFARCVPLSTNRAW